ncbi:MAG: BolA family transcriptional regulator [Alphaproteobacteria bacterium]|nr:BolA family transcriptional regulator [Alphaproteobacteria bacterium]
MNRAKRMETLIRNALSPTHLQVVDESARHAGHAGARPEGETHYRIVAVCPSFEGQGRAERHRAIYALLDQELRQGLHALSLELAAPSELGSAQSPQS